MPNKFQLAFLTSFFSVLSILFLLRSWALSKFNKAGYQTGILGHELDIIMDQLQHLIHANVPAQFHTLELPILGTLDVVGLLAHPAFIITTIIVVATAFYSKVMHTGRTKPLDPNLWKEFPLESKIKVSPNTAIYRFTLPHVQDVLGLPVGQHINVSAEVNGKTVTRSYTPISNDDDRGRFDIIVKTYEKGNVSKYIGNLRIGDKLRVKGPKGNFLYTPNLVDHLSLIAGGTGIAPMIQVIRAALRNPFDRTTVTLIYANVNEEDILLKDDLEELADVHSLKFNIFYVLNNPPPGWKGGAGFVTTTHIKEHLPNPSASNSKILICGPPPMVAAMKKNLQELSYPAPNTISKVDDKVFVF